jgi:type II secretory pathway component PulJ
VITAETEGEVLRSLREKEKRFEEMSSRTVALARDIERAELQASRRELLGYEPAFPMEVPEWAA